MSRSPKVASVQSDSCDGGKRLRRDGANAGGDTANQASSIPSLRIPVGIVDRKVRAGDALRRTQGAYECRKLVKVEARPARRIHGGHDSLVEDVQVDMQYRARLATSTGKIDISG